MLYRDEAYFKAISVAQSLALSNASHNNLEFSQINNSYTQKEEESALQKDTKR